MSGIAGVAYRDGRRAEASDARAMVQAMSHRARGEIGSGAVGAAALGHGHAGTMAERHGCLAVADARIDNRDELGSRLSLTDDEARSLPEAELILLSYLEWGVHCPEQLLGDFAFAIWDGRSRSLFCGRDRLGAKPLCIHVARELVAFGSEPKALLAVRDVPHDLNEEWVCYHFYPELLLGDKVITSYRGIERLAPAHSLLVTPSDAKKRCYWKLDPFASATCTTEEEYVERFRSLFLQAVERRLPSEATVATTLSGGLDSSSVACAARDLLSRRGHGELPVYSAVFDSAPDADERYWIDRVVASGGFAPRPVRPDETSPLVDLDTVLWLNDGPFYGTNYFIHWALYRAAAADGVAVMLDGEDGDTTVSHGIDQLLQLVQSGAWNEFTAECDAIVEAFGNEQTYASRLGILRGYAIPYLEYLAESGKWRSFLHGARQLSRSFGVSQRRLLVKHGLKRARILRPVKRAVQRRRAAPPEPKSVVNEDLLRTYRIRERVQAISDEYRPRFPSHERQNHLSTLSAGALPYALESIERFASFWGIEVRHPFCDSQLAEFALSVPAQLKLRGGVSRYVIREALAGVLPETVRTRSGKGDLSSVSERGLLKYEADAIASLATNGELEHNPYVDAGAVRSAVDDVLEREDSASLSVVWQTLLLTRWLGNEAKALDLEMGSQVRGQHT